MGTPDLEAAKLNVVLPELIAVVIRLPLGT